MTRACPPTRGTTPKMNFRTLPCLLAVLLAAPRAGQDGEPAFAPAVEQAQRAFAAGQRAATVAALQQAIRAVQRLQRTALLGALPTPKGFRIEDVEARSEATDPFAAEIATLGLDVERRYRSDGTARFEIEIATNSPLVQVFARLFDDPAAVAKSGGAIADYGRHRGLVQFRDDHGEVTLVLRDRHVLKVTCDGMTAAELAAIVDAPLVERLDAELAR